MKKSKKITLKALKNRVMDKLDALGDFMIDPIEDHELMASTVRKAKTFIPDVSYGKVIKVYDGDTITIATRLSGKGTIYKFSVRLLGIDTPEMKSKVPANKKVAVLAKNALKTLIYGQVVHLKEVDYDKYGRILAEVYFEGRKLSEWMIEQRFAVAYDGGTKSKVDWPAYYAEQQ